MATTGPAATLIDTSVLLDVLTADPSWAAWSAESIERTGRDGALVINPIVYAELTPRFPTVEELDLAVPPDRYLREHVPWPAAYLAGRAHARYRRSGGARTTTLPDFFIGAHATVAGLRLLTRDAARYRAYFPTVELIAPA